MLKFFERRRAQENFYKDCIRQVEQQGWWLNAAGEKMYDTVEHLQGMLQKVMGSMA